MKTTSGASHTEESVVGGSPDVANVVGLPTTDSLSAEVSPNNSTEVIETHQEEGHDADAISEDGISPDDAPEVVLDDINEEGEVGATSMLGRLGHPQSAAAAIKKMKKLQDEALLQALGNLCVASKKAGKSTVPRKNNASQKNPPKKSSKKRKDRHLIEESILRMRTSTASPREPRVSQHRRVTPPRHSGPDQSELDRHEDNLLGALVVPHSQGEESPTFDDSAIKSPSQVLSPKGNPAPVVSPSVTPPRNDGAISASREKVDEVRGAPLVEAHSDSKDQPKNISTTGTDVGAPQSTVAEREEAGVRANAEVESSSSMPPVDAPTDPYLRGEYDPNMEIDQVDMQVDLSCPMDKEEDKSEPWFGVLSNTTFHPPLLPTYSAQPQLYSHGLSIEEDDHIIDDIGPRFVADSVMEDARTERADIPVTATETLRPFSWVPAHISDAFHATFPVGPFAPTQMTALFNDSVAGFQHHLLDDPYVADMTISEETRLQQVVPPPVISWPFFSDGVHPSPSVEVGLSAEPQSVYAKYPPTSVLNPFAGRATSCSPFPPLSSPTLNVGPVPVRPSVWRPVEGHKKLVKDLDGEVHPEPAVAASGQRETSPPRGFYTHNVVGLDAGALQWRSRPSPANSNVSSPLYSPLLVVDTTAIIHSAPTPASPIEHGKNEIEGENRDSTKSGHSDGVHEILYPVLPMARPATQKSASPMDLIETAKSPPRVPPRIVGSKRKFVEDQGTWSSSINPAREGLKLPPLKKPKLEHGDYSTLGPVPVFPSFGRPIEGNNGEVKDFERGVDPEPAVGASVQREASPPRSLYTHNVVGLDAGASQRRTRPSPTNSNVSSQICTPLLAVATTVSSHSAPTPASPIEHGEIEIEGENRNSTMNSHSDDVHEIIYPTPPMAQPGTQKSAPPMDPVGTAKSPPRVPPRIVGSKRKFVEDGGTRSGSINPGRKVPKLPRSKKPKLEHGDDSMLKGLGEVRIMHRQDGEGAELPEAIKFATRHAMPVWASSSSLTNDQKSGEAANWGA